MAKMMAAVFILLISVQTGNELASYCCNHDQVYQVYELLCRTTTANISFFRMFAAYA